MAEAQTTFLEGLTKKIDEIDCKSIYYYSNNYPEMADAFKTKLIELGELEHYEKWKADYESERDAGLKEVSRNYNRELRKKQEKDQASASHENQSATKQTARPDATTQPDNAQPDATAKTGKAKTENKTEPVKDDRVEDGTDTLKRFHSFNDKGYLSGTLDDVIAEDVIDSQAMLNYAGIIYLYDGGWYVADDSKAKLKELISERLYLKFKKYQVISQIHNHILTKSRIMVSEDALNSYPVRWINFNNGMLDVETMQLHPHDQKYNALNQIPYPWIDKQPDDASITVRYLTDLINDPDDLEMFLQFCGYCMTRDTSQQAFMIIHGSGGTGKSVLLRLLSKAIGKRNICNIPLQAINSERFASAFLFGKLVNIYADLPSKDMAEVDALKTITGEDSVRAEIKGGAVFSFYPYCKLIFSANKIPKSRDDKTDAYYRRMRILTVNRRAKEIPDLEAKLEADIQSFIWLCIQALHRMYKAGKIIESDNSELEIAQLYADTDSVQAFLTDCEYTITGEIRDRVNRADLYNEYEQYCKDEGRDQSIYSATGFYSNLRDKGCIINNNIRMADHSNARAIAGIRKDESSEVIPFT